jgi:hypothetical protein
MGQADDRGHHRVVLGVQVEPGHERAVDLQHGYRSRLCSPDATERPGPDADPGPWTIEFTVEPTALDAC